MRTAFSIIEVLIVVAIVAVIAGIVFAVSGPTREKSREASCMVQIRQLYMAHSEYAIDSDASGQFPELHGLCYIPKGSKTLRGLGVPDSVFYCPSLPPYYKSKFASTYIQYLSGLPINEDGTMSIVRRLAIRAEAKHGLMAPVLDCTIHDELFYEPKEKNVSRMEAQPFTIRVCLDGSVHAKRYAMPRMPILENVR